MLLEFLVIFVCLALGGLLKGATGAGAPILAVPALAAVFDVPFAIAMMVVPNLLTNSCQIWHYRHDRPSSGFLVPFVGGGVVGVATGTWLLTELSSDTLLVVLSLIVFSYIGLRLARPRFRITDNVARVLSLPAGLGGGLLLGATGVSGPISITFLNAMRLTRPVFIFTISLLFALATATQMPALMFADILTAERLLLSSLAVIPVTAAMPLGSYLATRLPDWAFDRLILVFLAAIAVKMLFDALV